MCLSSSLNPSRFHLETCSGIEIFASHLDTLAFAENLYAPNGIVITFLLKSFTLVVVVLLLLVLLVVGAYLPGQKSWAEVVRLTSVSD